MKNSGLEGGKLEQKGTGRGLMETNGQMSSGMKVSLMMNRIRTVFSQIRLIGMIRHVAIGTAQYALIPQR